MDNRWEEEKARVAAVAVKAIQDGMVVGVGSGSTANHFIRELGAKVRQGLSIIGVPTSEATAALCQQEGIPLVTTSVPAEIDLTVDGADQLDSRLRLIKGGGGYLLREKIVAFASQRVIIIADSSKLVDVLGATYPLPIEVLPFAWIKVAQEIRKLGGDPVLRLQKDRSTYLTDQGNYILDCKFPAIADPEGLAEHLSAIPGLLEHGLFIQMASEVLLAQGATVSRLQPEKGPTP